MEVGLNSGGAGTARARARHDGELGATAGTAARTAHAGAAHTVVPVPSTKIVTVDRVDAARVGDTKVATVGHADERTASAARAATAAASKRARHAEKRAIAATATATTASACSAVKDMLAHSTRVHLVVGFKSDEAGGAR